MMKEEGLWSLAITYGSATNNVHIIVEPKKSITARARSLV